MKAYNVHVFYEESATLCRVEQEQGQTLTGEEKRAANDWRPRHRTLVPGKNPGRVVSIAGDFFTALDEVTVAIATDWLQLRDAGCVRKVEYRVEEFGGVGFPVDPVVGASFPSEYEGSNTDGIPSSRTLDIDRGELVD